MRNGFYQEQVDVRTLFLSGQLSVTLCAQGVFSVRAVNMFLSEWNLCCSSCCTFMISVQLWWVVDPFVFSEKRTLNEVKDEYRSAARQNSARVHAKQSAASTRTDAIAADCNAARPKKSPASGGEGRREHSMDCTRTSAHHQNGEILAEK